VTMPVRVTTPAQKDTKMTKLLSSVENLKSVFEWSSVSLLALTFVAGAGVVITSRIVNKRQEETIIGLQTSASDAKAAQQKVEIDLGNTQKEVADARKKQAEAEADLVRLNEAVKRQNLPRFAFLHPLSEFLKGKPTGTVEIIFLPGDKEASETALWLEGILSADAHWKLLRHARPMSDEPNLFLPQFVENPFNLPLITRAGLLSDITIIASPADLNEGFPREGTAVHALWRGLHTCGFQTVANVDSRLAAGTARVVIGARE
jgi:hypothetical protein